MKPPREDEIRIATEAARWQRALESDDPTVRSEFADWIKASPRHLREFIFMEALESAAKGVDPHGEIDVDLDCLQAEVNVVPLYGDTTVSTEASYLAPATPTRDERNENRASDRRLPAYLWQRAFIAASTLVGALAVTWWFAPTVLGGWDRYATSVGEQRTVALSDGSLVQLNTRSRVQVRFTKTGRDIRLVEGEALFKVAHDAARAFRVAAGDTVVRAVGTEFNVYRQATNTAVTVLEGRVQIQRLSAGGFEPTAVALPADRSNTEAPYLVAGHAAHINSTGEIVRDPAVDVSDATAWRQRRLVFREEPLSLIVDEFNRYNRHPQLVIEDEAAGGRRYGGTFDADDPESLVQFVTRAGDITVERTPERIVLRTRKTQRE